MRPFIPQTPGLYLRTVRHLTPLQIVNRVKLRALRAAFAHTPRSIAERMEGGEDLVTGWPGSFSALATTPGLPAADPASVSAGNFTFLAQTRSLEREEGWDPTGTSLLWRYNLHYLEWAFGFLHHDDPGWARACFGELWQSWDKDTPLGRWPGWSPYVASLRGWVMCALYEHLVAGSGLEQRYISSLRAHRRYIGINLETDVGGNHLIKNLKALVGLGIFLGDQRTLQKARHRLGRELLVQVLADGGHYERSPSYHAQVLEDLIDVRNLLEAAEESDIPGLRPAISSMQGWLASLPSPGGRLPPVNDSAPLGTEKLQLLLEGAAGETGDLVILEPSGYFITSAGPRLKLFGDIGLPCPPNLPAHAHADCLSFELIVDGEVLIVDAGTSTYERGEQRSYERSTRAHNTVVLDGSDQTEVWGTFRAAARAIPQLERTERRNGSIVVTASHDGYERLSGRPRHRRTWIATSDEVQIWDEVDGKGSHGLDLYIHLAPGAGVTELGPRRFSIMDRLQISFEGECIRTEVLRPPAREAHVALSFGRLAEASTIRVSQRTDLPTSIRTSIGLTRGTE